MLDKDQFKFSHKNIFFAEIFSYCINIPKQKPNQYAKKPIFRLKIFF